MSTPLDYQRSQQIQTDGDLSVVNYQSTALLEGDLVVLDTTNQLGGPVPTLTFWNIPTFAVRKPASGSPATGSLGVITARIDPRASVPSDVVGSTQAGVGAVATRGVRLVTARGAVTAGHLVSICTVANFEGKAQSAASGEEAIGQALVTAADGDVFPIRLFGAVVIVP